MLFAEHLELMKDNVILANAGHFDVEISKGDLNSLAVNKRQVRPNIEEFCWLTDAAYTCWQKEGWLTWPPETDIQPKLWILASPYKPYPCSI